jgi:hypothetical protein
LRSGRTSAPPFAERVQRLAIALFDQLVEAAEVEHREPLDVWSNKHVGHLSGTAAAELGEPGKDRQDPDHVRRPAARVEPIEHQPPAVEHRRFGEIAGVQATLHPYIDRNHGHALVGSAHLSHRHVVDQSAVDQHVAALGHRWEHARDGHARPDGPPAPAPAVDLGPVVGEVRRHTVERQPEVLDVNVAGRHSQPLGHASASGQRGERDGGIDRTSLRDHAVVEDRAHLLDGPPTRDSTSDERAGAGAADGVDRDPEFAHCSDHADLGHAPSAAAG